MKAGRSGDRGLMRLAMAISAADNTRGYCPLSLSLSLFSRSSCSEEFPPLFPMGYLHV